MKNEYHVGFLVLYDGPDWTEHFMLWIGTLSKRYRENAHGSERAAELIRLCDHLVSKPRRRLGNGVLVSVLRPGLLVQNLSLVEKAMTVRPVMLCEEAYTELGGALHRLGPAYLHGER